jgi:hypothetical protein
MPRSPSTPIRPLLLFSLFRGKLSASDVSFAAEILDRHRFGNPNNSKTGSLFLAVSRCIRERAPRPATMAGLLRPGFGTAFECIPHFAVS